MADMLLDTGYYNVSDPRPYDDTGWTLGPLFNAETVRVEDAAALDAAMTLVEGRVKPPGGVQNLDTANPSVFLVDANADLNLVTFRYKLADVAMEAAESGFEAGGRSFNPGTFIISASGDAAGRIRQTATDLGVTVYGVGSAPEVATHPVSAPRVAIMHGWGSTQNEGWVRMAFDEMELPHDYISDQDARGEGLNLREKYDVIVLGSGFSTNFNEDPTEGNRIPWKAIPDLAPNIGRQDETDDMRLGMGPHGLDNIKRFVSEGGLLIAASGARKRLLRQGSRSGQPDRLRIRRIPGRSFSGIAAIRRRSRQRLHQRNAAADRVSEQRDRAPHRTRQRLRGGHRPGPPAQSGSGNPARGRRRTRRTSRTRRRPSRSRRRTRRTRRRARRPGRSRRSWRTRRRRSRRRARRSRRSRRRRRR
jgi:hypothetical protein